MGIITESSYSKHDQIPWDSIEIVRTKSDQTLAEDGIKEGRASRVLEIKVSGSATLTLSENCVTYRKNDSRRKRVIVIPLRNVEIFDIQTRKSSFLLLLTISLLIASATTSIWRLLQPLAQEVLPLSMGTWHLDYQLIWVPVWLLLCGMGVFVAYMVSSQTELLIQTVSGNSQIKVPLPRTAEPAVESYITNIELRVK